MHFPLLDECWGADEEILLLEAIEMYGLGNWSDVSDHVGTKSWLGKLSSITRKSCIN